MAEPSPIPATDDAPAGTESEDESRTKRTAAFVLTAIAIALLLWWILSHLATVPETVGMSRGRAESLLAFAGFETSVTPVPAGSANAGRVLTQAPAGGLYFTWRPVYVTVGVVVADENLDAGRLYRGFSMESGEFDLAVPEPAAEVMPTDSEEVADLYMPPHTWETLMPNVQNRATADAIRILRDAGLRVATQAGPSTTDVRSGRVYYQSPAPGSAIRYGQKAVIWGSTRPFNLGKGDFFPYPRPPHSALE